MNILFSEKPVRARSFLTISFITTILSAFLFKIIRRNRRPKQVGRRIYDNFLSAILQKIPFQNEKGFCDNEDRFQAKSRQIPELQSGFYDSEFGTNAVF